MSIRYVKRETISFEKSPGASADGSNGVFSCAPSSLPFLTYFLDGIQSTLHRYYTYSLVAVAAQMAFFASSWILAT